MTVLVDLYSCATVHMRGCGIKELIENLLKQKKGEIMLSNRGNKSGLRA
jgi:hypothetical protein